MLKAMLEARIVNTEEKDKAREGEEDQVEEEGDERVREGQSNISGVMAASSWCSGISTRWPMWTLQGV
jgi:hypothetical protein